VGGSLFQAVAPKAAQPAAVAFRITSQADEVLFKGIVRPKYVDAVIADLFQDVLADGIVVARIGPILVDFDPDPIAIFGA